VSTVRADREPAQSEAHWDRGAKAVEDGLRQVTGLPSESTVRAFVDSRNARIRHVNASITVGPASTLMPLDAEKVVVRWHDGAPD